MDKLNEKFNNLINKNKDDPQQQQQQQPQQQQPPGQGYNQPPPYQQPGPSQPPPPGDHQGNMAQVTVQQSQSQPVVQPVVQPVLQPVYQPVYQPVVAAQPVQSNTTVVVTGNRGTGCRNPACQNGYIIEDYSMLGIILAVVFFPIGIMCCMMMKEKKCRNCGSRQ